MGFNKTIFEAFVAKYDETCCSIHLDNGRIIYIGYPGVGMIHKLSDIEITTIGGEDFLHIIHTDLNNMDGHKLDLESFVPIDEIKQIGVCQTKDYDGTTTLLPDPKLLN